MKRFILIVFLAGPSFFGFVKAEKTMFVDCLLAFQVSIASADQGLQDDLEHCRNDADWLLRGWCRKEATLAHNSSVDSALTSYDHCQFGTP